MQDAFQGFTDKVILALSLSMYICACVCAEVHPLSYNGIYVLYGSGKGTKIQESCEAVCGYMVLCGKPNTRSHILRHVLG